MTADSKRRQRHTRRRHTVTAVALGLALSACDKTDPVLEQGKVVWDGTCKVCHLNGMAGAPKIGDTFVWKNRIAQGTDVLVSHALNGFEGNQGTMPARGGNPGLTDSEVAAAVQYMVSQSE